jgi:hypothetical protein
MVVIKSKSALNYYVLGGIVNYWGSAPPLPAKLAETSPSLTEVRFHVALLHGSFWGSAPPPQFSRKSHVSGLNKNFPEACAL